MGLKKKIHEIIREQARFKAGLLATFGAGFIIAVCTVICTGQVYLPTIGFVMGIPELRKNAISCIGSASLSIALNNGGYNEKKSAFPIHFSIDRWMCRNTCEGRGSGGFIPPGR